MHIDKNIKFAQAIGRAHDLSGLKRHLRRADK
jgi:hypothetical protein